MNHRLPFACLVSLLLFALMGWHEAHATACPHTGDVYFDPVPGQEARNLKFRPQESVSITGYMEFVITEDYHEGGDSCMMSFPQPGSTFSIGGGLTLTLGKVLVRDHSGIPTDAWKNYVPGSSQWLCGVIYPKIGSNYYLWGNSFTPGNLSWSGMGYETWGCSPNTSSKYPFDIIKIPFTITGTYDGSLVNTLKPYYRDSPYAGVNGIFFDGHNNYQLTTSKNTATPAGLSLYVMAEGQHSAGLTGRYPDNGSTQPPATISAICASMTVDAPTTNTAVTVQSSVTVSTALARVHTSTVEGKGCNFTGRDTLVFKPRTQPNPNLLINPVYAYLSPSQTNWAVDWYSINCVTNCLVKGGLENIRFAANRKMAFYEDEKANPSVNCQAKVVLNANDGFLSASNLQGCHYFRLESYYWIYQTGAPNSQVYSTDPNNPKPLYTFTPTQMGKLHFSLGIDGCRYDSCSYFTFEQNLLANNLVLNAPMQPGCANVGATTYPPDSGTQTIYAAQLRQTNDPKTIGDFFTTTMVTGCQLTPGQTLTNPPLSLSVGNQGTPNLLTLTSSVAGAFKNQVVDTYQLRWNDCPKDPKTNACLTGKANENIQFKVTRSVQAQSTTPGLTCSPSFTLTNGTMNVSAASNCDRFTFTNAIEVVQTGNLHSAKNYDFATPFAQHAFTAPMQDGSTITPINITGKAFTVVPTANLKCQVVIQKTKRSLAAP